MTREQLLKEINDILVVTNSKYLDDVIENKNKILDCYDDFQSYTCKNCKYSDDSTEGTMICRHPDDAMPFHIPLDFGCVPPYFEEKEKTK